MPVVRVNLGEPQGVLEAGTWLLELENVDTEKKSRVQQLDMHQYRFRAVEPEAFKGKAHFENIILSPDSIWTLDRALRALGMDVPEDKAARENFEFDPETLYGNQCVVILGPQTDNPQYTQTLAMLTVEQAEAQGLEYGPASDEDDDEEAA